MDIKQNILLVLTVCALGFLGYQIFQLVDQDINETPVLAERQADIIPSTRPVQPVLAPASTPAPSSTPAPASAPISASSVLVNADTPATSPTQQAYMKMLSQYEMAKLHRQLLDEEAAVADAQQKIAVNRSKTKAVVESSGITMGSDSTDLDANFQLSYVDQKNGQWSATLHKGTDYQSVAVGASLPGGYQVSDIDRQGVTLQKDDQRELITFNGVVKLALPVLHPQPVVQQPTVQQPTVQQPAVQAPARSVPVKLSYPVVIKNQYEQESADTSAEATKDLSAQLHLQSVEIRPVISEAYSIATYLPPQDNIPQNYHLTGQNSSDNDTQYSEESSDSSRSAAAHPLTASEKKLLELPAAAYTIQLIGSYHKDVVDQFILDNGLKQDVLELTLNDAQQQAWTVALYGTYHSFAQAESRLVRLPATMRLNGAWIRKIGDIKTQH